MENPYDEILAGSSQNIRELVEKTRRLIHEVYPQIVEVPWFKQRIVGFGVGQKKNSEHFCYITIHKAHINLGFNYGTELPDPDNVLQGTGKLYRHVRLANPEDIDNPAVRVLLQAASRHRMPERD